MLDMIAGVTLAAATTVSNDVQLMNHQVKAPVQQERRLESKKPTVKSNVLSLAKKAHKAAKSKGQTESDIMAIIDYSMPSNQKRLWVVDIKNNSIILNTHVAHGKHSGLKEIKSVSNVPNSYKSSLGVFKTGSTYQGKHGRSMYIHGLEKGFNDNAYKRRIVMHSSPYVGESFIKKHGRAGRSLGCPATSPSITQKIISLLEGGKILFVYYPEQNWLKRSKYVAT